MKKLIKNNLKVIIAMTIVIILGIVGIAFALKISNPGLIGINANSATITANITYDTSVNDNVVSNNGKLMPIEDSQVTYSSTDERILKAKFYVTGVSSNPSDTIYDIALHNVEMDCELRTTELKWKLFKNGVQLSTGNFSPTFDTIENQRLVLTNTQEDLTTTRNEYVFMVWVSESCTGDILTCTKNMDQSKYLNKAFEADIKVELATKSKKTLTRKTGSELSCSYQKVGVPTCNVLTYNGNSQTLINSGSNYTLTNNTGTNAGNYTVTASLSEGYKWTDGTTGNQFIDCTINKKDASITALDQTVSASINYVNSTSKVSTSGLVSGDTLNSIFIGSSALANESGTLTPSAAVIKNSSNSDVTNNYNINYISGRAIRKTKPTITIDSIPSTLSSHETSNYSYTLTPSGTTPSCTSSNTSIATCSITSSTLTINTIGTGLVDIIITVPETTNYDASNFIYNINVECNPTAIEPIINNPTFNGDVLSGVSGGNHISLSGTLSGTNVGEYMGIATPDNGYCWEDGTRSTKTYTWKIEPGLAEEPVIKEAVAYTGTTVKGVSGGKNIILGGTTSATAIGSYTATATPKTNYAWADKTTSAKSYTWRIDYSLANYISNLYNNASRTNRTVNSVTYSLDSTDLLSNDSTSTTTGNVRYYGASPNNYVAFNCTDYSNKSTCELWRIIGVIDGKVKLIRPTSIGNYSWDTSASTVNSGYGINQWGESGSYTGADLMNLLNPGYESKTYNNSLYWNSKSGKCLNGRGTTTNQNPNTACDFTSTGIKNDTTRNMIADATWYTAGTTSAGYVNAMLNSEINGNVYTGTADGVTRTKTWEGKIALPTPSDYGYAAIGNCSSQLSSYNTTTCANNNWLKTILVGSNTTHFLTPYYSTTYRYTTYALSITGAVSNTTSNYASGTRQVFPTLFLEEDVVRASGTGTSTDPYMLIPSNKLKGEKLNSIITKKYSSNLNVTNNNKTYNYDTTNLLMKDTAQNIRYYGLNPNNYIYYNCDDYSDESTCELWRIIGVFGSNTKIIRNEPLGEFSWDFDYNGYGTTPDSYTYRNNWNEATLKTLLNTGYYNNTNTEYYSNSFEQTSVMFNTENYGIKNEKTRKMIALYNWNLGGINAEGGVYLQIYPDQSYTQERGTTVYRGNPTSWSGYIALPYPSDYGYAADFRECNKVLGSYGNDGCYDTDWLYNVMIPNADEAYASWFLTAVSTGNDWGIDLNFAQSHAASTLATGMYAPFLVSPTLYLNSNVEIIKGDGSIGNPYVIR